MQNELLLEPEQYDLPVSRDAGDMTWLIEELALER